MLLSNKRLKVQSASTKQDNGFDLIYQEQDFNLLSWTFPA